MVGSLRDWWRQAFADEPPLHAIDRRLAKEWIKRRLVAVYPELKDDPKGLEQAYRALSLEPRDGAEEGEAGTIFHARLPEQN